MSAIYAIWRVDVYDSVTAFMPSVMLKSLDHNVGKQFSPIRPRQFAHRKWSMKTSSLYFASTWLLTTFASPLSALDASPPDVARKPHPVTAPHGATRNDGYYWLRDDERKNPRMLAYLNAENDYTDTLMAALKPLEEKLYREIVGRIKQDDSSVPYRERAVYYAFVLDQLDVGDSVAE